MRTRIDRTLVDERMIDRVTDLEIKRTKVSDHDIITWTIQTKNKKSTRPCERLPVEMLEDKQYQKEVRKMYEEERGGGIEGYERFKARCVEKAVDMKKKRRKKKKRDTNRLNREIRSMRHILNWTENAIVQNERGNKVKRWKKGEEMIRRSNPKRWMGKSMGEIMELKEIEEKAAEQLDKLLEERHENNE